VSDADLVARRKERSRTLCVELFGKGNVNVAHEIMAPGVVSHGPGAMATKGEGTIIRQALFLRRAMPDLQVSCEDQVAEGDRVTTRWSATGTHTGPLTLPGETVEPTGRTITFSETRIDRYDGETIVESWITPDPHSAWQKIRLTL
jgi:predicted ester cyclase